MRILQKVFFVTTVVTLFLMTFVSFSVAQSSKTTQTIVVNNSDNPVPVTGSPETPVWIKNVENPALQPFQWTFNKEFTPTEGSNGDSFFVPAGKRLVIEFVSGTVGLGTSGDIVEFGVRTTVNDVIANHRLVVTSQGPAWGYQKSFQASQSMRVYADPETTVTVWATNNLNGDGVIEASVSGYLVDYELP